MKNSKFKFLILSLSFQIPVSSFLLDIDGLEQLCLTNLEIDHTTGKFHLELEFSCRDRSSGINVQFGEHINNKNFTSILKNETRFPSDDKLEIKENFKADKKYMICFNGIGPDRKYVFIKYPEQSAEETVSVSEMERSVRLLYIFNRKVKVVKEKFMDVLSIGETHNHVIDEIEDKIFGCFLIKCFLVLFFAWFQTSILLKLLGKKIHEFRNIQLPI